MDPLATFDAGAQGQLLRAQDQDPIIARVTAFVQSLRSSSSGANTAVAAAGKLSGVGRAGGRFLAPSVSTVVIERSLPVLKAACDAATLGRVS